MKSILIKVHLLPVLLLIFLPVLAFGLDAPHTDIVPGYTITCSNCHWVHGSTIPPWASVPYPDALDDNINNRRCFACHEGTTAPYEKTHSTTSTSSNYWSTHGGWTTQCVTCHDPHKQNQTQAWSTETFLVTGPLNAAAIVPNDSQGETTITLGNTPSADYSGYYIIPDIDAISAGLPATFYKIRTAASGSNVVTVKGIVNTSYLSAATTTYAIIYGKNIRSHIVYKNPGSAVVGGPVKLFLSGGDYSAGDSVNKTTSVCYICHTQGKHWSTIGDTSHNDRTNCTICHEHTGGFKASCNGCHGNPPTLDSPTKTNGLVWTTVTRSVTAGAHDRHVNDVRINCAACHYSSVGSGTSHNNRSITIGFGGFDSQTQGGNYDGQSGVVYEPSATATTPASTVSTGGTKTCSSVYCHGSAMEPNGGTNTSPVWGSAATGACGTCHGATAANPPLRGSHRTHVMNDIWSHAPNDVSPFNNYIYGRNLACTVCHNNYVSSHVNGKADWSFDTATYSLLSGAQYRGSGSGSSSPVPGAYGQCTNLYCHSIVQTSTGGPLTGQPGEYKSPTWGTMSTGTCGTCHGVDLGHAWWADLPLSTPEIATGSHTRHLEALGADPKLSATPGGPARCTVCHNYVGSDNVQGCASVCHNRGDLHVNYRIDVRFAPRYGSSASYTGNPTPGSGFGGCANTYCHSSVQGNPDPTQAPSYVTPTWGQTYAGTCGRGAACHAVGHAHPSDSGYTALTTGSHAKHLLYKFDQDGNCQSCHYDSSYSGCTNCHNRRVSHVNRTIDIVFNPDFPSATHGGGGAYSGDSVPQTPYGSCSNLYCHSQGTKGLPPYDAPNTNTVTWGGSLPADCTACHGGDPSASQTIGTGSHGTHVQTYRYDCSLCHATTVSDSRTLTSATYVGSLTYGYRNHANGWVNVAFWSSIASEGTYAGQSSPLNYRAPGTAYAACGNTYCHSNGTSVATGAIPSNNSPNWGGVSAVCTSCHNYSPDYSNGNPKANSHVQHGLMTCEKCHWLTTQTGSAITDYSKHANRRYDVGNSAGTIIYSYSASGGSCSGPFGCHSSSAWGGPPKTLDFSDCISCHKTAMNSRRQIVDSNGDGTGAGGDFLKTSHHVYPAAGTLQNADCRVCHDTSQHPGGAIRLIDADTGAIYTYDPANPVTAEPFCLSCHDSNGANGTMSPFSDGKALGVTPYRASTDIKNNWNKTYGHKQKGLTCLGNGNTNTGCHSNGHGSANVGLLGRSLTLPNASTKYYRSSDEASYDACFACHSNYQRVTKEAVMGYRQGGNYDVNGDGPPPYNILNILTKFRDRNGQGSGKVYDDITYFSGQFANLHYYHVQSGGWSYRGSVSSSISCTACHSVHGSNTQSGWVYDELQYTRYTDTGGDQYGTMALLNYSQLANHPTNCAFNCHNYFGQTYNWSDPSGE
ncbi:MAG: CxxxxCH/CxxCH domain-containing protein [Nitrospiraceae bacterium]|nr:CxxxxCH/CxxCH domain-containing protein [Nitrospiraceae bacterium]